MGFLEVFCLETSKSTSPVKVGQLHQILFRLLLAFRVYFPDVERETLGFIHVMKMTAVLRHSCSGFPKFPLFCKVGGMYSRKFPETQLRFAHAV